MTEVLDPARHASAAPRVRRPAGGLAWGALLLSSAAMLLTTTNPVPVLAAAVMIGLAGALTGGPRRPAFRVALAIGSLALVWRLLAGIAVTGSGTGTLLLDLPSWQPAPGVRFGGPVTVGSLAAALTAGVRAWALVALIGLGWLVLPGRAWLHTSRAVFGRLAELLTPWCLLGDSLSWSWLAADVHRAQGWRVPTLTRAGGAFAAAGEADPPSAEPEGRAATVARPFALLLIPAAVVAIATGAASSWTTALSPLGVLAVASLPLILIGAARERPTAVTACAAVALAAFCARSWLPGAAALDWQPSDGWPGIPYLAVAATLLLPVAALLTDREG
ncbi:hypothetical protein [Tessaracoccus palaemonis]|uniref:Integral membrane protein n=1 Tax=Tessaracoccus palaemonis TaxID=2829499 RepID=A0ABX8SKZ4_9ACTN|nr:hypothetical protein [Tessaracoccus palaemonis]QXT63609.1 hypothetical protein KDB89_03790 [Tessaracoccus palaemonis]